MENNKDQSFDGNQPGTGSAENVGRSREDQVNKQDNISKKKVADDTGLSQNNIAHLYDLGATSGRDDYSGSNNDGMDAEDTGKPTDR